MQKIEGTTIMVNRGDVLNLTISLTNGEGEPYTFQIGDKLVFSLYNTGSYSGDALLMKEVTVDEEGLTVDISLSSEETKIGDLINKPVNYWYEVELNDQYTVIGYDEDGAKVFTLFPEGSKVISSE
jgi:V8-like Glu-specific endopeptidase